MDLAQELTSVEALTRLGNRIAFPRKVRRKWQMRLKSRRPMSAAERQEFLTFQRLSAGLGQEVMPGKGLAGKRCAHCLQPITGDGCACYHTAAKGVYRTVA